MLRVYEGVPVSRDDRCVDGKISRRIDFGVGGNDHTAQTLALLPRDSAGMHVQL